MCDIKEIIKKLDMYHGSGKMSDMANRDIKEFILHQQEENRDLKEQIEYLNGDIINLKGHKNV